jgi:hypothetical protein
MVTPQTFLFIRSYAKLRSEGSAGRRSARLPWGWGVRRRVVDAALFVLAVAQMPGGRGCFSSCWRRAKGGGLAEAVRGHNAGEDQPETFVRSGGSFGVAGRAVGYWLARGCGRRWRRRGRWARRRYRSGMKTADNARFVRAVGGMGPRRRGAWLGPYGRRRAVTAMPRRRRTTCADGGAQRITQPLFRPVAQPEYGSAGGWSTAACSKAFSASCCRAGCMTDMAASCVFPAIR